MSTNRPEDFLTVRQFLAGKKHEQPPPAYFDHFADRVIARLEADETGETSGWWNWLMEIMEVRPVLASAAGVALSAALLMSLQFADTFDLNPNPRPLASAFGLQTLPTRPEPSEGSSRGSSLPRSLVSISLTSLSPSVQTAWSMEADQATRGWSFKTASFYPGR